jgi:hypothetical protein
MKMVGVLLKNKNKTIEISTEHIAHPPMVTQNKQLAKATSQEVELTLNTWPQTMATAKYQVAKASLEKMSTPCRIQENTATICMNSNSWAMPKNTP